MTKLPPDQPQKSRHLSGGLDNHKLDLFIACPRHFEDVLVWELKQLGIRARASLAGASCQASWPQAYRIILHSRVASRVLWNRLKFPLKSNQDLYHQARRIAWHKLFDVRKSFVISTQGQHPLFKNSMYAAMLLKDAVVDDFREHVQQRPDISKLNADIALHLSLQKKQAVISIDLAGRSLHQRGYRSSSVVAPIKENLAAALLYKSRWQMLAEQGKDFVDLFCGSATLVIEAAMMARNIAPGLLRQDYSFQHLSDYQDKQWQLMREKAQAAQQENTNSRFYAIDIDVLAIKAAKHNAANAGVGDLIHFYRQDALQWNLAEPGNPGLLMSNLPYGQRLAADQKLYLQLGQRLKSHFGGWQVALLGSNEHLLGKLKLAEAKKIPFYNGRIESCLLQAQIETQTVQTLLRQDIDHTEGIDMFKNRLQKNRRHLQKWAKRECVYAYRVYDADLPEFAVAIDYYQSDSGCYLVVQEYRAPKNIEWQLAAERLAAVIHVLPSLFGLAPEHIFLKRRQKQKGKQQYNKQQQQASTVIIEENGLKFKLNLSDYLDTGLFLDHRMTRQLFANMAKGKRVLNLFAYTSSVGVYAAAHGALKTVNIDLSNTYLNWSKENYRLNGLDPQQHEFIQADCSQWLQAEKQKPRAETRFYDLIFLDPPTFSNSKKMDKVFDVQKNHQKMIFECMSILNEQGVLLFSCNYRKFRLSDKILRTFRVEDISQKTIPEDFRRNKKIHHCFLISKKDEKKTA